jgi:DNA polymerase I-like protein with 3'-5' exonuclease and polymerase domains
MWLAGLRPDHCRFEYLYPYYPVPGGSLDKLDPAVLHQHQADTLERISRCIESRVVVCVGNVALETLTSHRDISRRRGSVYEWRGKKVVGIVHPGIIRKRPAFEKCSRLDWERIAALAHDHTTHHDYCGCAIPPKRNIISPYTDKEGLRQTVKTFMEKAQGQKEVMAIDVETPKINGKRQLYCVSFAFDKHTALVLPFGQGVDDVIRVLCASPCIKVGHNFVSFDRWWLEREGFSVYGEIRDTMCIHHALDPASLQSLEFLTSRYTWEPWYKDEGKGHDIVLIKQNEESYYHYCGMDSCVTKEIHDILWQQLQCNSCVEFYKRHYEALYDPILDIMLRGVRIDHQYREATLHRLLEIARRTRDHLGTLAGKPLYTLSTQRDKAVYDALVESPEQSFDTLARLELKYGKEQVEKSLQTIEEKTVSNTQLKELLYGTLGLPVQVRRRSGGEETASADAVALRTLRLQYADDHTITEILDLAADHNKAQKLASFLYPNTFDTDGRFRFTLKLNTEAARLASSKAPNGLGRNSQNTSRDDSTKKWPSIRRTVLPEPGHVILEADASQIEGRIVFVRTKDPDLIKLGRARIDFDQHSYVASLVFNKPIAQVGKGTEERQMAKSVNHAAMRDMQGKTMADRLMKDGALHPDGTPYLAEECDVLLEAYYRAFPAIRLWQQLIRRELRTKKYLKNSWDRIWDVHYEEMNDDLFRKGYNFLPQSECADLTNIGTLVPLWNWLNAENMQSVVMMQEHDALVCSCPPHEVYDVAMFLKSHLEVEREYDGVALSVPAEFSMGSNYGEKKEFKELPERKVLEATAKEMVYT